jgi:hypothetical protein
MIADKADRDCSQTQRPCGSGPTIASQILPQTLEERVPDLSVSRFRAVLNLGQMPLCAIRFAKACVFRTSGWSRSRRSAADTLSNPVPGCRTSIAWAVQPY